MLWNNFWIKLVTGSTVRHLMIKRSEKVKQTKTFEGKAHSACLQDHMLENSIAWSRNQ